MCPAPAVASGWVESHAQRLMGTPLASVTGAHLNGASYQLQYDVVQDFEPVSLLANTPQWIVARKTLPAKDRRELIAWLKENPGKALVGTVGVGGGGVIADIYFQKSTGTRPCGRI